MFKKFKNSIVEHKRILINFVIPFIFIGFFTVVSLGSAAQISDTTDEKFHLTRGVALLSTGDLRINQHHPYLYNLITALPLIPDDQLILPNLDDGYNWINADKDGLSFEFVQVNAGNEEFTRLVLFYPRVFTIFISAILLGLTYFLLLRIFDPTVAILFLSLFATNPNLIAHNRLVTTDMASTYTIFLTTLAFYYALRKKVISYKWILLLAFLTTVALMIKYSAIFALLPLTILIFAHKYRSLNSNKLLTWKKVLHGTVPVIVFILSIFIALTVAYKLQFKPLLDMSYENPRKIEANLDGLNQLPLSDQYYDTYEKLYSELPLPFPQYINGFYENVFKHNVYGHSSYFMGEYGNGGWLLYFPTSYLLKEPISTLVIVTLALIGFLILIAKKKVNFTLERYALIIPPVILGALSLISSINLGIRHILVLYPFIFLLVGLVFMKYRQYKNMKYETIIFTVAIIVNMFVVMYHYPYYIPYFNMIGGGPSNGYEYLRDSNFDWGQSLLAVLDYIDANPDKTYATAWDVIDGADYLIISKEDLYRNPKKKSEEEVIIMEKLDSGEYEIVDEIAYTHVVIKL